MSTLNVISNFAANVAHRHLSQASSEASNSVAKLSAGSRVLAAKDDAAALAIGSRLNSEVESLKQAGVNAGQAVSMLQIADGAMARTNDILVRMKTLAVQSSSGQLSNTERGLLNQEYTALRSEVDRIADDTEFNGTKLLAGDNSFATTGAGTAIEAADGFEQISFTNDTGAFASGNTVQIGYDATADQFTVTNTSTGVSYTSDAGVAAPSAGSFRDVNINGAGITITLNSLFNDTAGITATAASGFSVTGGTSDTLSLDFRIGTGTVSSEDEITVALDSAKASALSAGLETSTIDTNLNAETAIGLIDTAIDTLAENRAQLGASQNRLEFASANIATSMENTEAARSALMDLDVAAEMTNFTSKQILMQSGVSMLAQANQMPQNLLRLLG
ncbi:flagellin N-terminal helical domain-containing protein [Algihabitans albus]|uniref:flagellin N-terminal helical domain-containing protein n=1 Tax=Algihabitans albus TaxID=2164067 RepID=UPI000E5C7A19|nr:flagellin [Algihabitans albus]